MSHALLFLVTFFSMEFAAWSMHRFVMHGFCWNLHQDHHTPLKHRWWQLNDSFALFFAIPSFLTILLGSYWLDPHWATFGYGIMAYGIAYFFIHEVVIHRRLKFLKMDNWYINGVTEAHRDHHKNRHKEGAENFGMLIVPFKYFKS